MALMVTVSRPLRFRPPPGLPRDAVYLLSPLQILNTSVKLSLQEFTQTFVLMLACPTMVTKFNGGGAPLVSDGDTLFAYGIYCRGKDWSSLRSYLDLPHTILQLEENSLVYVTC
ncbi:Uncharacterized protein Rs2_04332 [Raphanus sativus]|uniref:Uncharacterized protein LOC108840697 n=1 Tax=Raphanus sativus TaxID=3726 RepID=A0A6J0MAL7_RAPSA|nr:uncharacterized protein LOC108840697 [Raphanus sativus]KAJ4909711.1 Uncharacterized protein Rs2_04332 [Raphanus sativus]